MFAQLGFFHKFAGREFEGKVRNLIGYYQAGELLGFADFPRVKRVLQRFLERPAAQRGLEIPKRSAIATAWSAPPGIPSATAVQRMS